MDLHVGRRAVIAVGEGVHQGLPERVLWQFQPLFPRPSSDDVLGIQMRLQVGERVPEVTGDIAREQLLVKDLHLVRPAEQHAVDRCADQERRHAPAEEEHARIPHRPLMQEIEVLQYVLRRQTCRDAGGPDEGAEPLQIQIPLEGEPAAWLAVEEDQPFMEEELADLVAPHQLGVGSLAQVEPAVDRVGSAPALRHRDDHDVPDGLDHER